MKSPLHGSFAENTFLVWSLNSVSSSSVLGIKRYPLLWGGRDNINLYVNLYSFLINLLIYSIVWLKLLTISFLQPTLLNILFLDENLQPKYIDDTLLSNLQQTFKAFHFYECILMSKNLGGKSL